MGKMKILLDQFSEQLSLSGSHIIKELQPGIDRTIVEKSIRDFSLNLPDEVFELYAWRNGLNPEYLESSEVGEMELFKLGIFPPFEISLEEYNDYAWKNNYYEKSFFPLFGSGGGDYFLINCEDESNERGRIYYFTLSSYEFDKWISMYDSLETLIQTITYCYKEGAYSYNLEEGPSLQIDIPLEREICRVNNPLSDYWKSLEC